MSQMLGPDPVSRRQVLRGIGLGATALATGGWLAACGSRDGDATGGTASGRLVVGAGQDGYTTEGIEANIAQYPLNANVYENLIRMSPDYQLLPALATAWMFEEPNTWVFSLRDGVVFHDGRPFTAEAVKHTFDRIAEQGGGLLQISKDSTEVADELTVRVTPGVANSRLPAQVVHPSFSILAPGTDPASKRIGTGPFAFVRYEPKQEIVVRRFEKYWGGAAPLERITFRFIPDSNSRRLSLQAGDVDVAYDPANSAVASLEADDGLRVAEAPVGAYEAVYLNTARSAHPALRDVQVRRAIGYALDRNAVIEAGFAGIAADVQTLVPPRLLGRGNVAAVRGYGHDPKRAQRMLDRAGWTVGEGGVRSRRGSRLALTLVDGFPSAEVHGSVPELLQAQLREVGIAVDIVKTPDSAAYADRLNAGNGDLWLEQGSQNNASPAFFPALLFTSQSVSGSTEGYHALFSPGRRYDRVIDEALAAPDLEQAKSLSAEALSILIDQTATVLPLAGIHGRYALAGEVAGFSPAPSELHQRYETVRVT